MTSSPTPDAPNALADIRLVVLDVDGVLTDGSIIVDDHGVESKRFHVRDGWAIKAAQSLGLRIAALTGRSTRAVTLRMSELGVDPLLDGVTDKAEGLLSICARVGVEPRQCAYVGDDLIDLPAMQRCGYPITVADGAVELRGVARYVTQTAGGHGAVREAIEHILKGQKRWSEVLQRHGS